MRDAAANGSRWRWNSSRTSEMNAVSADRVATARLEHQKVEDELRAPKTEHGNIRGGVEEGIKCTKPASTGSKERLFGGVDSGQSILLYPNESCIPFI